VSSVTALNLVDPELRAALQNFPQFAFSVETLPLVRQVREAMLAVYQVAARARVTLAAKNDSRAALSRFLSA
jgi:hypothetical protein